MKKKSLLITCLVMVLVLSLVGACAKPAPPAPAPVPAPAPAPAPAPEKPEAKKVKFAAATGPVFWGTYPIILGWSKIINDNSDLAIIVECTAGAEAIQESVHTGRVDIGQQTAYAEVLMAYTGTKKYADKPWSPAKHTRLIIGGLNTMSASWMTSSKTGITTMEGLRGNVLAKQMGQSVAAQGEAILEAYGIDPDEDVERPVVQHADTAWVEIQLGRMDAVWDVTNEGLLKTEEEVGQIVWLPIAPEKVEKARAAHPETFKGIYSLTIEPGDVPGLTIPEPILTLGYFTVMYTTDKLPDYVSYTIVKTLLAHQEEVRQISAPTGWFSSDLALASADVAGDMPYHPGAVKAFKELGLWTSEHEAMQKRLAP